MQLKHVSAKSGYLWFRQGIRLFCRSPLIFISLFFTYLFVMGVISLPPVLGTAILLALIPGVSVGFLAASRDVLEGKPAFPTILLSGYRAHGSLAAKRLLILGLVYFVAICGVFAISSIGDGGDLAQAMLFGNSPADATSSSFSTGPAMLLAMLCYVPVAMAFWFAPVLVAWHGIPPHKALFFSLITCWRNKLAFILYGVLWLALTMGLSLALTIASSLLGLSSVASLLILTPVSGIITAALYCSFYATYRGSFEVDGPELPMPGSKKPTQANR